MCGICGEIRFDGQLASVSAVEKMQQGLVPRGPDAGGIFAQRNVAFGHRRLKIIDLSEKSAQPLVDSELGLTIVFNGAIYNYPELREELQELGYNFFSSGDTEVILKAYHAWGRDCLERFNGMFAFAIWSRESGEVFIARDRLGIKPLYYIEDTYRFRFSSSLPSLLRAGEVSTEIDPEALHHYLSFHAVVPPPRTILKQVRKLPQATSIIFKSDGTKEFHNYWKPSFVADSSIKSATDWEELVIASLREAVKRRLTADVDVGVLLSGGLDSSLIVGLLAEAGQKGLNTFSIGFESVDEEKGDEFQYSDIIAKRYDTKHHKIFVDASRALPSLERCVTAMSEPMVSHDAIGFYLLSEEVSKHLKVVQSGQGADEVFGGYSWYPPLMQSTNAVDDYASVFFDRTNEAIQNQINTKFHTEDVSRQLLEDHFSEDGANTAIEKALRLDTSIMLVDDPVKRVDNMTMAWGLEARVPFLDHELVELAARVPAEFKIRDGGKYVLKEAARKIIPSEVIDRPKGYFPVPVLKKFRGPYLDFVKDIVTCESFKSRGLFKQSYVDSLLEDPDSHITPLQGSELWQVALLEYWFQCQGIKA